MSDFLAQWFLGFEEGIESLEPKEKEKLFLKCACKCADTGILDVYKELYKASGKDLDVFFAKINELDSIGGKVIQPGKLYEISFPNCLCDLYTLGYVHSEYICECSRQSIIYVMKCLEPELSMEVHKLKTVLNGDEECRFAIAVNRV